MLGAEVMTFAEKLRELRFAADMTQEQLAEKASIPLSSLRSHEQGQRSPSWGAVVKLSRALGVTADAFSDCDEVQPEAEAEKPAPKRRGKK